MLTKFNLAPVPSIFSVFERPLLRDLFDGEERAVTYAPRVDVVENKENFVVRAELPGMKKDEVQLTLENNVLTLSGEKRQEEKRDEGNYHLRETRYGKFERSFRLTDNIDRSNITADYKDGVLTITLPKTKESQRKEIAIKMS
ncbi:MAG: Hsp20/alpha crystallin family protein [candidate division KSB1 bacterium]|nr:Hsp20/alpha crystallin family protein [candidate division KSB1 bacterium]MDZ7364599.1 Hsp20/alpha crystallin family protein [candidate division KSB1 bacterium]MDZ7402653.1 Hsp20/alpha crystallin family protein [candidate division KSB1 bacterium]